jgi:hypothetical protein
MTEPLRLAHRLRRDRTWLYSARRDQVVPRAYGRALAKATGIRPSHHRHIAGCHYSCVLTAPWLMADMIRTIRRATGVEGAAPTLLGWVGRTLAMMRMLGQAPGAADVRSRASSPA